jgi:hypothetical protein
MSNQTPRLLPPNPKKVKRGLLGEILALENAAHKKLITPSSKLPDVAGVGAQLLIGGN